MSLRKMHRGRPCNVQSKARPEEKDLQGAEKTMAEPLAMGVGRDTEGGEKRVGTGRTSSDVERTSIA